MNRWIILLATGFTYMLTIGQIRSVGVYYLPYVREFNTTRQLVSTTFATLHFCSAGSGATGYALASLAHEIWHVALAYLVTGLGNGATVIPCHTVLAERFPEKHQFAFAMLQVGVGVGIMTFNPWFQFAIDTFTWRGSCLLSGSFMLLIVGVGLIVGHDHEHERKPTKVSSTIHSKHNDFADDTEMSLMEKDPKVENVEEKLGLENDEGSTTKEKISPLKQLFSCQAHGIWKPDLIRLPLLFLYCVCAFGAAVTNDHNFVSFAILRGVEPEKAPWIQSVAAIVDIVIRILMALYFARLPKALNPLSLVIPAAVLMAISLLLTPILGYSFITFVVIAAFGLTLAWGSFIACYATTVHHLFGMDKFPLAKGITQLGSACGGILVPVLAGTLSDIYDQSYAYYVAAAAMAVGVFCLLILRFRDNSRTSDDNADEIKNEKL